MNKTKKKSKLFETFDEQMKAEQEQTSQLLSVEVDRQEPEKFLDRSGMLMTKENAYKIELYEQMKPEYDNMIVEKNQLLETMSQYVDEAETLRSQLSSLSASNAKIQNENQKLKLAYEDLKIKYSDLVATANKQYSQQLNSMQVSYQHKQNAYPCFSDYESWN